MDRSKNKKKRRYDDDQSSLNNKRQKSISPAPEKNIANAEKSKPTAQSRLAKIRAQQELERSNRSSSLHSSSTSIDPSIKLQKNVVKFPLNDCQNKTFDWRKKTAQGRNNTHSVTLSCVSDLKNREVKTQKLEGGKLKSNELTTKKIEIGLSPSDKLKAYKREGQKLNKSLGNCSSKVRDKEKSSQSLESCSFKHKSSSKKYDERSLKPYESKIHHEDKKVLTTADKKIQTPNVSFDSERMKSHSTPLSAKSSSDRLKVYKNSSYSISNSLKIEEHSTPISSKDKLLGFFTPPSSSSSRTNHEISLKNVSSNLNNSKEKDFLSRKSKSVSDRLKVFKNSDDNKNAEDSKRNALNKSNDKLSFKNVDVNSPHFSKERNNRDNSCHQSPLTKFQVLSTHVNSINAETTPSLLSKGDNYSRLPFGKAETTKSAFRKAAQDGDKSDVRSEKFNFIQLKLENSSVAKSDSLEVGNLSRQETSSVSASFATPLTASAISTAQSPQESGVFISFANPEASTSFTHRESDPFGKSFVSNSGQESANQQLPNTEVLPSTKTSTLDESNWKSSLFSFGFVSNKLKSLSSVFFQGGNSKKTSRFTPYGDKPVSQAQNVGTSNKNFMNNSIFLRSSDEHFRSNSVNNSFLNTGSLDASNNNNLQRSNFDTNFPNRGNFSGSFNTSNHFFSGRLDTSNQIFERNTNFSGTADTSKNNVFQNEVILDVSGRHFGNENVFSRNPDICEDNVFAANVNNAEEENVMDWSPETEEDDVQNLMQMKNMISEQTSYHESEVGKTFDEACGGENDKRPYVVVDTNVFLHKLEVLANILKIKYEDGTYPVLYVPWMVIQELDYFKDGYSTNKKYAKSEHLLSKSRKAISFINQALIAKKPNFKCEPARAATENSINITSPDDSILSSCLNVRKEKSQVMLLSGDINLRNKGLINGMESLKPENAVETLTKLKKLKQKEVDLIEKASQRMSWLCSYIIYSEWKQTGDKSEASRFEKMPWSFPDCVRYMKENYDRVFKPFLQKQSQKIIDDIYNVLILDEDFVEEMKFIDLVLSLLIYMKTGMRKYERNIALVIDEIKKLSPV